MQSCMDLLAGVAVPAQQQVDIKVFDAAKADEAQKYHRLDQGRWPGVLEFLRH